MAEFVAMALNVEVNGQTVLAIVNGMGAFRSVALEILKSHNIDNPKAGSWYPQQAWLDAFKEIKGRIGTATLFQIGQKIPENAELPPQIDSIEKALESIDVAYHMNHRGGEIGRYAYSKLGPNQGKLVSANPYPCEFDLGLVTSFARRFSPVGHPARVAHDDAQPCRRKGGGSCTYLVSW